MRYYETLYILNPNFEQAQVDNIIKEIDEHVSKLSSVINHRVWGKKRLAYPIDQHKYGIYIILQFETQTTSSLNGFDDFMNDPIPNMIERIKINLWQQSIRFYDYVGPFIPVPLYLKSRFISENFENFSEQQKFDVDLTQTCLFDFERKNPSKELLTHKLNAAGYLIDGSQIIKQ